MFSSPDQACISRAFVPVMRSMWPGVNGNAVGYQALARKRAVNVSRFLLQLMQTPLCPSKAEEAEKSPGGLSTSGKSTLDIESGEEGLAIRIAAEVRSAVNGAVRSLYRNSSRICSAALSRSQISRRGPPPPADRTSRLCAESPWP